MKLQHVSWNGHNAQKECYLQSETRLDRNHYHVAHLIVILFTSTCCLEKLPNPHPSNHQQHQEPGTNPVANHTVMPFKKAQIDMQFRTPNNEWWDPIDFL